MPIGAVPVEDLTTRQILYGARTTRFRYELLEHDPATGVDSLVGFLDGVEPGGSLNWSAHASVKKSGTLNIVDLPAAADGLTRIADVNIVTTRIRPVMVIDGLPEIPLSLYVVTASPEKWEATGRTYSVEMHDKSTVLAQDAVEVTYTANTSDTVLEIVRDVIESAGESIAIDGSESRTLLNPMVWEAGTTKLAIVNDLLNAINYNSLWVDGVGAFRVTPYVRPAQRSIRYTVLNDENGERIVRELTDGAESIYQPNWSRDRDTYKVPNKVVTVAQGSESAQPLSGVATNENPDSPYSYPSRGRWIVRPITGVEVPDYSAEVDPDAATEAFLNGVAQRQLIAASAVQARISVSTLPIPVELLDSIRFASTPAGIDARHTTQAVTIPLSYDGLMRLDLQEVIDL